MSEPTHIEAVQVARVRCDGCGTEWQDLDAAIHQDGFSAKGCPNGCRRLTTPVYWPHEDRLGWYRLAFDEDER